MSKEYETFADADDFVVDDDSHVGTIVWNDSTLRLETTINPADPTRSIDIIHFTKQEFYGIWSEYDKDAPTTELNRWFVLLKQLKHTAPNSIDDLDQELLTKLGVTIWVGDYFQQYIDWRIEDVLTEALQALCTELHKRWSVK